ncbi:hypothetical protein [Bizionia paragorgiae]|uniref:hypothetical protein n=1 Tax=Bizionia paragorgiae TaxID=283786 RepID=UPI00299D9893|nr:hypothetical protein [Bizionia paragorgiae]MDX1272277.1 hypothetical protein [Bizionia paragorgiae]
MNKIIIIIFSIILLGCNSTKTNIQFSQIDTEYPIILRYSKKYNKFYRIEIPLKVKIKNNSLKEYSFASIRYVYNSKSGGITETIYKESNQDLIEILNNKKKIIKPNSSDEYIIYSSHRLDSNSHFQENFKSFIGIIQNKYVDTVSIGSVRNFKKNNKKLLNTLTANDSISINMWKANDIRIPVKL